MSLNRAIVAGIYVVSRSIIVSGRTVLAEYWIHSPAQLLSQTGDKSNQAGTGRIPRLFLAIHWSPGCEWLACWRGFRSRLISHVDVLLLVLDRKSRCGWYLPGLIHHIIGRPQSCSETSVWTNFLFWSGLITSTSEWEIYWPGKDYSRQWWEGDGVSWETCISGETWKGRGAIQNGFWVWFANSLEHCYSREFCMLPSQRDCLTR